MPALSEALRAGFQNLPLIGDAAAVGAGHLHGELCLGAGALQDIVAGQRLSHQIQPDLAALRLGANGDGAAVHGLQGLPAHKAHAAHHVGVGLAGLEAGEGAGGLVALHRAHQHVFAGVNQAVNAVLRGAAGAPGPAQGDAVGAGGLRRQPHGGGGRRAHVLHQIAYHGHGAAVELAVPRGQLPLERVAVLIGGVHRTGLGDGLAVEFGPGVGRGEAQVVAQQNAFDFGDDAQRDIEFLLKGLFRRLSTGEILRGSAVVGIVHPVLMGSGVAQVIDIAAVGGRLAGCGQLGVFIRDLIQAKLLRRLVIFVHGDHAVGRLAGFANHHLIAVQVHIVVNDHRAAVHHHQVVAGVVFELHTPFNLFGFGGAPVEGVIEVHFHADAVLGEFRLKARDQARREAEALSRGAAFDHAFAVDGLAVAHAVLAVADLGEVGRGLQNGQHIGHAVLPGDAVQLGDDAVVIRVQRVQGDIEAALVLGEVAGALALVPVLLLLAVLCLQGRVVIVAVDPGIGVVLAALLEGGDKDQLLPSVTVGVEVAGGDGGDGGVGEGIGARAAVLVAEIGVPVFLFQLAVRVDVVHRAGDEHRLRVFKAAVGIGLHLQKAVDVLALEEAALRPAVGRELLVEDLLILADDVDGGGGFSIPPDRKLVGLVDCFRIIHPHGGHADLVAAVHVDVLGFALLTVDKAGGDDLGVVHAVGAGRHVDIAHRGGGPDNALVVRLLDIQAGSAPVVSGTHILRVVAEMPVAVLSRVDRLGLVVQPVVNEELGLQLIVAVGHVVHAGGDDQLVKAVLIHVLRHQIHHGLVFHGVKLVDGVVAQQLEHVGADGGNRVLHHDPLAVVLHEEILRDERGLILVALRHTAGVGPRDIHHNGVLAVAVKVAGGHGEGALDLMDLHFAELGDILKGDLLTAADHLVVAVGHVKIQGVAAGVQRQIGHILLLAGAAEVHARRGHGLVALGTGGEVLLGEVDDVAADGRVRCPLLLVPVQQAGQAGGAVIPHGNVQFAHFHQGRPRAVAGAVGQFALRLLLFRFRPFCHGDAEGVLGGGVILAFLICQRRHGHGRQQGQHHRKGERHAQQSFGCLFHVFAPFWGRKFSAR